MKQSTAVQRAPAAPPLRLVSADEMVDRMHRLFDSISHRAFEIFERNGRRFGREIEDWLQAEAELLHPLHVEISATDDALTVQAEVPGFAEKDIQVSVEPHRLTISGKREAAKEEKKGNTVYTERCAGEIFRALQLPADVDTASSAMKAVYDRGMLTITLPKLTKPKGREIKVEPAPSSA